MIGILSPVLDSSFDRVSHYTVNTSKTMGSVKMEVYPFHMNLDIWVEARNILGTAESEHLQEDAGWFGKRRL